MTDFQILPFVVFCLAATGTPGPNNMINLAQGMRVGFWRALPFAVGTGIGIATVLIAVSLGLGAAFEALPWARVSMAIVTLLVLLFLAWKIATAGTLRAEDEVRRIGFFGGVGFQWINPKTWVSSIAMATVYLPGDPTLAIILLAGLLFCLVSWVTQPIWIGFGSALRNVLSNDKHANGFNWVMAALLLASTLPVLIADL